jgi:hypothetical protein
MHLVFRALGVAAAANAALGRYSVNFVPSNLIIVGVAAAVCVFNVDGWIESRSNSAEPRLVGLPALLTEGSSGSTFIGTTGALMPDSGFEYGETGDDGAVKRVTMRFVPLVDKASGRGVFLQLPAAHRFGGGERDLAVTGMLRPMQEFLARELRTSNFRHDGVQMLPERVLVVDETPGEAGSWLLGTVLSGAVVVLFLALTVTRNTIFVRRDLPADAAAGVSAPGDVELRATGRFVLEKASRRFINVPAVVSRLDNGDLAALANVDASSSFMGMTYKNLAGIWMLPIAAGSIQGIEEGILYFGRQALPSIRFQYRESGSNASRTAILSAPTAVAQRALLAQLFPVRAAV